MSVTPATSVSLPSLTADVAYRRTTHTVRHVRVHRHVRYRRYARGRHYYYRSNAFPAAALGLFGLGLGAAIASSGYDDWYGYPYGYGYPYYYGGYYPSYSYGYVYPRYGYRHRVYGGYGGRGVIYNRPGMVRGGFAGGGFRGMGGGGFRGGMGGGGFRGGLGGGGGRGGHR